MARPALIIDTIDLRKVTRKGGEATILLDTGDYQRPRQEWIRCGAVCLHGKHDGETPWTLGARAAAGVTDFEHDSLWIFQIPVVGASLSFIDNGVIWLAGWIGGAPEDLHVPILSGYDPSRLPGSSVCTACAVKHRVVPEGYFAGPPANESVWQQLVGRRIQVLIRPTSTHTKHSAKRK